MVLTVGIKKEKKIGFYENQKIEKKGVTKIERMKRGKVDTKRRKKKPKPHPQTHP